MRLLVDLLILVAAATFEVAGDAMIRSGLRGRGALFVVVGVLVGKLVFHESVPPSTWLGLTVIVAGAAVVQMGIQR